MEEGHLGEAIALLETSKIAVRQRFAVLRLEELGVLQPVGSDDFDTGELLTTFGGVEAHLIDRPTTLGQPVVHQVDANTVNTGLVDDGVGVESHLRLVSSEARVPDSRLRQLDELLVEVPGLLKRAEHDEEELEVFDRLHVVTGGIELLDLPPRDPQRLGHPRVEPQEYRLLVGKRGEERLELVETAHRRGRLQRIHHQLGFGRIADHVFGLLEGEALVLECQQERVVLANGEFKKACHDDVPIFCRYICLRTIRIQLCCLRTAYHIQK